MHYRLMPISRLTLPCRQSKCTIALAQENRADIFPEVLVQDAIGCDMCRNAAVGMYLRCLCSGRAARIFCYDEAVPHMGITACVRVGRGRNRMKKTSSRSTNSIFAITGVDHQSEMQTVLDQISLKEQPLSLACACLRAVLASFPRTRGDIAPASDWYIWDVRGDGRNPDSPDPTVVCYHLFLQWLSPPLSVHRPPPP